MKEFQNVSKCFKKKFEEPVIFRRWKQVTESIKQLDFKSKLPGQKQQMPKMWTEVELACILQLNLPAARLQKACYCMQIANKLSSELTCE